MVSRANSLKLKGFFLKLCCQKTKTRTISTITANRGTFLCQLSLSLSLHPLKDKRKTPTNLDLGMGI
jgi:hypothetical protein